MTLAAHHIRGGCVDQGARGCVLSRADRPDICNRDACVALTQAQAGLRDAPDAVFVALVRHGNRAVRQAAITKTAAAPLLAPDSGT